MSAPIVPDFPDVWRASEERCELMRLAAVAALRNPAADPASLDWARHCAAFKPLGRPLTRGPELTPEIT